MRKWIYLGLGACFCFLMLALTPAETQRALEKKYGVIPSYQWFSFYASHLILDDSLAPVGTELVFKVEGDSGRLVTCGAGLVFKPGMMRYCYIYEDDYWGRRRRPWIAQTGAHSGDAIMIFNGITGVQYDYSPFTFFRVMYRDELDSLRTK